MSPHHTTTQQRQSSAYRSGEQPQQHQGQGAQRQGLQNQRGAYTQSQERPTQQGASQQHRRQQERQHRAPVFQTANFLPAQVRSTSVDVCNQVLADAVVVHAQLKGAHWNVRGPDFYQLHELFDDLAESLEPHADEIAERVTALGGVARGSVRQAAQSSTLPPLPEQAVDGRQLLRHVAQALAAFDATLYQGMETVEQTGDLDTVDLLNEVSRDVSKSLWFVEAHLQEQPGQIGQPGRAQRTASIGQ